MIHTCIGRFLFDVSERWEGIHLRTRKQNLQANSRSACQFWYKREKETQRSIREITHSGTLFLPPRVEIELNFTLQAAFSEILAVFENCHIQA